jgi:hypothetical protein
VFYLCRRAVAELGTADSEQRHGDITFYQYYEHDHGGQHDASSGYGSPQVDGKLCRQTTPERRAR